MKTRRIIQPRTAIILLILGLLFYFHSAHAQPSSNNGLIKERRFQRLMNKENVIVLDVRTLEEYKTEHIPQSKLIDVQQKGFVDSIQTLTKNKTYLIYCRSGKRSQIALNLMKENGFKRVYHLKGGMIDWSGPKETRSIGK